ncbi:hypothetical protein FOZ62_017445, partial [Perkinsus olseni]
LYAVFKAPVPGHPPIPDGYTVEVKPVPGARGPNSRSGTSPDSPARLELHLSRERVEEFMKAMVGDTGLLEEEDVPACILSGLMFSLDEDGVPQMTLSATPEPGDSHTDGTSPHQKEEQDPKKRLSESLASALLSHNGITCGPANEGMLIPSTLGWQKLFCGTKQLNDLRLLVSVYANNTSDRTGSILVFIDEPLSHFSFFAVMPIDGQTDQPERHMLSVFNFPSSFRGTSRMDGTFKERVATSLVVCLAEASFPHVIIVSVADTRVPNKLSLTFRNDFCQPSSRGVPSWGLVEYELARDGSSIAQQQRHYTRKTERSLLRHLSGTSCRMLRDGCIVEADDKSISYRYCPKGGQDGSAETAIPVVAATATLPSNDKVEVLYAANRSVPGAEASSDLRILLKFIPLSLEEAIPTSRGLTLTFSVEDLSSTHLIVPSHDGRPFIFTTLVTLGEHTFVLSILQDSDVVRIALGPMADGQRTLWQGAVMFSAEDVELANFRAPYPSPNEHRASMLHWFTSSPHYVTPVSGTGTRDALSKERESMLLIHRTTRSFNGGNITAVLSLYFGSDAGSFLVKCYTDGGKELDLIIKQHDAIKEAERENAASGIATDDTPAHAVRAMPSLQGGSVPRPTLSHLVKVDVASEALSSARREVRLADRGSCSVMVELFEGCSEQSIQAFHAINYTIKVRELDPADGKPIRTILVRDTLADVLNRRFSVGVYKQWVRIDQIHESDLTDWLSAYSQEDLLSVVNAPLLEAAI